MSSLVRPASPEPTDQQPRRATRARWVVLSLSLLSAYVLLRTGPGKVPVLAALEVIARDWPTSVVSDTDSYVLRAGLGHAVYAELWPHGTGAFLSLHALALAASGAVLLGWLLRSYGATAGTVASAVLLLSPLTPVLLLWIGMYDAFSVLVWVLLVVSLRHGRPWQVAAAVLCGLQNFEQVAVGLVMLALLPELSRAVRWRTWSPGLLGGALLGKVLLELYLGRSGAPGSSRLSYLLEPRAGGGNQLEAALQTFGVTAPLVLVSVLGGLWAFAVPVLLRDWTRWTPSLRVRLVVAAGGWLLVGVLGLDHTRVMVVTAVPLLVAGAIWIGLQQDSWQGFWSRPPAWLLLVFPPLVVFDLITLPIGVKLDTWGPGPF